jgi:hypothetical protein
MILTPVKGDLRRFYRLDGLEYRIAEDQTAQLFLLLALFSRQTLQQPVVLLLPDFFLSHCFKGFRQAIRAARLTPRILRITVQCMLSVNSGRVWCSSSSA